MDITPMWALIWLIIRNFKWVLSLVLQIYKGWAFSQVCKPVSMYRHSCLIDSFKLSVYLSALPQTPQEKKKSPVLLSICSFHETYLVLASSSQDFFLYYANRVTVVFWNVLFTGIPLLVHIAPHEWDWKLKLIKILFWIAVSFEGKFAPWTFSAQAPLSWRNGLNASEKEFPFLRSLRSC